MPASAGKPQRAAILAAQILPPCHGSLLPTLLAKSLTSNIWSLCRISISNCHYLDPYLCFLPTVRSWLIKPVWFLKLCLLSIFLSHYTNIPLQPVPQAQTPAWTLKCPLRVGLPYSCIVSPKSGSYLLSSVATNFSLWFQATVAYSRAALIQETFGMVDS